MSNWADAEIYEEPTETWLETAGVLTLGTLLLVFMFVILGLS